MPYYRRVGEIPRKRHTQFRQPDGSLYAADARTGKIVWSANLGLPFGAAPMTYQVNGTQYVAIAAGHSLFTFALR